MKINKKISPYNHSPRYGNTIKYIVIHYVGAVSTAKNNVDYFYGGDRRASAHYFVDENSIWQSVNDNVAAWHCGGGLQDYGKSNGGAKYHGICTNLNSIGIEMCVIRKNGKYIVKNGTIKNTGELVRYLMKKYNVPASRVIRHFDVTGKECPGAYPEYNLKTYLISDSGWKTLRSKLTTSIVASKFTLTGASYPTILKKGSRFTVKGKITSANILKKVVVVVERADNGKDISYATKSVVPNSKTYNLNKIDQYIAFRKLPVGEYRYKIKATDAKGTVKTLLRRKFKVTK